MQLDSCIAWFRSVSLYSKLTKNMLHYHVHCLGIWSYHNNILGITAFNRIKTFVCTLIHHIKESFLALPQSPNTLWTLNYLCKQEQPNLYRIRINQEMLACYAITIENVNLMVSYHFEWQNFRVTLMLLMNAKSYLLITFFKMSFVD